MTTAIKKPAANGRRYRGASEAERQTERRQRFVEAGLTVFTERGYHSSTVRSICAEAGLTERYFYESFGNSEELLCAVYDHVGDVVRAELLAKLQGTNAQKAELVHAVLMALLICLRDDPRLPKILFVEVLGVSPRVDLKYRESIESFAQLIVNIMGQLMDVSALRPPLQPAIVGVAIVGSVITVTSRWMLMGFQEPVEDIVANLHRLVMAVTESLLSEAATPDASAPQ